MPITTDSSSVFARRAASVASGVNLPEQRASGERRHLAPAQRTAEQHAMMAWSRSRVKAAFSAQRSAFHRAAGQLHRRPTTKTTQR